MASIYPDPDTNTPAPQPPVEPIPSTGTDQPVDQPPPDTAIPAPTASDAAPDAPATPDSATTADAPVSPVADPTPQPQTGSAPGPDTPVSPADPASQPQTGTAADDLRKLCPDGMSVRGGLIAMRVFSRMQRDLTIATGDKQPASYDECDEAFHCSVAIEYKLERAAIRQQMANKRSEVSANQTAAAQLPKHFRFINTDKENLLSEDDVSIMSPIYETNISGDAFDQQNTPVNSPLANDAQQSNQDIQSSDRRSSLVADATVNQAYPKDFISVSPHGTGVVLLNHFLTNRVSPRPRFG